MARRPNGDGTVRKRADGRWEGRIIIGQKEDGKPLYQSVFAKTQKELAPKLHRLIEEYRGVNLNEDCQMTLGEWLDRWMNEYVHINLRPNTIRSYQRGCDRIKARIGDMPIRKVTTTDIQRMYNYLKSNGRKTPDANGTYVLSNSSVRRCHMILHEAMDAAVAAHVISNNPTSNTDIPRNEYQEMQVLNENELNRFMDAIEKEPWWYDFFYTEITTGLRRGEICGLKWDDIDFRTGQVKIRRGITKGKMGKLEVGETKTATGRRVFKLPQSTLTLLKKRSEWATTVWIFPSQRNPAEPVSPSSAYHRLKYILAQAELPLIRFHDLRHTFATHAIKNGVDAKTLSGILGHTNASFTLDRYTHVTKDMNDSAADVVGGFLTEVFGKDLKPWELKGKMEAEP